MNAPTSAATYGRANPFAAPVLENRLLTGEGSEKETRHVVIGLEDSGITYKPGDSLGVFAQNAPQTVEQVLQLLQLDARQSVTEADGKSWTLAEALLKGYVLNRVNKKFVRALLEKLPAGRVNEQLASIVNDDAALSEYIYDRDLVDVLTEFPGARFDATDLLALLAKTAPRLYSIASSIDYCPAQVHLTVAVVKYLAHGREKLGFASGWLGRFTKPNETVVPIFVQPSKHFHLPEDGAASMIMVGPGTGIAPFRSFLQHRAHHGQKGRNWLFFGEQHQASDFFYKDEFIKFQRDGFLTRLDTAFSRDQSQKIYVQDRLRENGAEVWKWIDSGAYFYVCGDAKRMAKDVHQTLIEIVEKHGAMSREAATEYVEVKMTKIEKRYQRDVY
jgi:sulfite reductase (NADPH) flavoprotein alpha-component